MGRVAMGALVVLALGCTSPVSRPCTWSALDAASPDAPDPSAGSDLAVRRRAVATAQNADAAIAKDDRWGARLALRVLSGAAPCGRVDTLGKAVAAARQVGAFFVDGAVRPGDIAVFHNQQDANGNGEDDDWYTGAGVVVSREARRALVRTRRNGRLTTVALTVDAPSVATFLGTPANSYLRVPTRRDPADASYLSGQLYGGSIDIVRFATRCGTTP